MKLLDLIFRPIDYLKTRGMTNAESIAYWHAKSGIILIPIKEQNDSDAHPRNFR